MQLKVLIAALSFIVTTSLSAQNIVYDSNAEVRNVGSFTAIDVSGGISVYLSQGSKTALAVSVENEKNTDKILTRVEDGVLKIELDNGAWNAFNFANKKIRAYITVEELNAISLSAASIVKTVDPVTANVLTVNVSGGSILKANFKASVIKASLSSGSIFNLSGDCTEAEITASGGSVMKSTGTFTQANLEANGGSVLTAKVSAQLKARANGGSVISYYGSPSNRDTVSSGGSVINAKN